MVVKEVAKDEVWFSDSVQVFDRHVPILLELSSCFWFCLTELVLLCWTSMVICAILVSPSNFEEFVVRVYDSFTGFVYLWFIHTRVRSVACDRGLGAELACDFRWDPFRVECSFVKYFCEYKVQRSISVFEGTLLSRAVSHFLWRAVWWLQIRCVHVRFVALK